ncbi:hypothetical protein [Actinoplanes sp. M2I2]|uniref:hypothetical protein n=1 Tax=Actinoplanes sp. M2I2 TaxID=1734444 RepID=UPI0020209099|nr:hypothetical protein [Actinoplanes sp. M2I2]
MRRIPRTVLAGAAVAGGVAAAGFAVRRRASTTGGDPRWHSVTVFRPLDDVGANLPEKLRALEVQLHPAPGDRGTEVRARSAGGEVPDGEVQRVLRESRSLLEVGDVLQPGGPTTTPTPLNKPLRAITRRTRTGGLS